MDNAEDINKTKSELLTEIQSLRDRLATSEETLHAIQGGEVDAFVVSTSEGPRIFTLQTADQPYRLLVEEMQQGAAILSAEGLILYGNQSLANLLQRPLEKLIGAYFRQFLSLQDSLLFQSRTEATTQKESNTLELFLISSSAVEIPTYITISSLNVDETLMTCVVITDLTQQKRHEETLAAERLARLMLEQAGEAILVCDADCMIIRASQVACELWGPKLLGQPFDSLGLVPIAARDTATNPLAFTPVGISAEAQAPFAIASILTGESIQGLEVEIEDQRGQRLNLILSARPLADADSQNLGAVVLLTNITPRKRIETQRLQALADLSRAKAELEQRVAERTIELRQLNDDLQQSESTLRSFFDSAPMPMGIVELRNSDMLHLSDNGAAAEFFGTTSQAMQNRVSSDLGIPPATLERWMAYYREAERTQAPVRFEYCEDNNLGRGRWLAGSVCAVAGSPGGPPRFSYILEDITDRKESEAKLQASLKEKELLLKEIYHRVKNNLQVVYSLLNLQSRKVSDPVALSVLRDSQSRVRAMALVHEKLYKSQDLARIDLADYIYGLAYGLLETYRASSHRIALRLEIEPYSLDIETALPCGLLLTELMSNSLKYAFPGGRSGEIAILSSVGPDHQISLRVQDNGVGLPDDFDLQHLSSLGLSLVQNLSKQIKGDVVVAPQPVGTAFQITFPA